MTTGEAAEEGDDDDDVDDVDDVDDDVDDDDGDDTDADDNAAGIVKSDAVYPNETAAVLGIHRLELARLT